MFNECEQHQQPDWWCQTQPWKWLRLWPPLPPARPHWVSLPCCALNTNTHNNHLTCHDLSDPSNRDENKAKTQFLLCKTVERRLPVNSVNWEGEEKWGQSGTEAATKRAEQAEAQRPSFEYLSYHSFICPKALDWWELRASINLWIHERITMTLK